jgi:Cdc6-like AAA superfamily ATPase
VQGTEIVGRDEELQALSSFFGQSALPGALLIQGDPGIGKTTLWDAGVEAAREQSYVVLRASPAEKEATFSYSVVGDLLEHVLDGAPRAPTPSARGRAPPTRVQGAAA